MVETEVEMVEAVEVDASKKLVGREALPPELTTQMFWFEAGADGGPESSNGIGDAKSDDDKSLANGCAELSAGSERAVRGMPPYVFWTGARMAAASACWEGTATEGDVRGSDEVDDAVVTALGSSVVALSVVWFASSARAVAPDDSLAGGWLEEPEAEGSCSGSCNVVDTWWTLDGR